MMGRFKGEMYPPITMMRMTAIIRGRVQGVGYRCFVTDCVLKTGITGHGGDLPDGAVMIMAEGDDETLKKYIKMVQAEGDSLVHVEGLEVPGSKPTGEFSGFGIRRRGHMRIYYRSGDPES